MLEEFTSKEQQNSRDGLAFFSLKVALEHLIGMEFTSIESANARTPRR